MGCRVQALKSWYWYINCQDRYVHVVLYLTLTCLKYVYLESINGLVYSMLWKESDTLHSGIILPFTPERKLQWVNEKWMGLLFSLERKKSIMVSLEMNAICTTSNISDNNNWTTWKTNTILPLNDWVTRSSLHILKFVAWARFPVSSVSLHLHGLQCKANSCGNGRTITGHKCIFSVCKSLKWFWSCILMTSNDELLIGHARSSKRFLYLCIAFPLFEMRRWNQQMMPYLPPSATLFEQNSLIGFQNAMPKLRVLTKGEGGRIPRFRPHPWIRGPFLGVEFQWIWPEMWTLHHPAHEQSRGLKYSWHELRFFV